MRCRKATSRARSAKASPNSCPPWNRAVGKGPIPSSFGAHFVFVDERAKGSLPPLDTVREAVQREWLNARRIEAEQKLYRTLRDRYQIVVETPPKAAASEAAR